MKSYDELGFTDDFIFCKVLTSRPDLCKKLLEIAIGHEVGEFVRQESQKPIEITSDGRGVRFDVYVEDNGNAVYDCEMQTTNSSNLPKRSRYYQGMIDLNLIERGADYNELKKSYVIFICPFDVFKRGLHRYTFKNCCIEDPTLQLGDDATKIFLCAGGTANDVPQELMELLDYISTGNDVGTFSKELEEAVQVARDHEEWRVEYMTLLMRDKEMMRKGHKEGLQQGLEQGMQQGTQQARINAVQNMLRYDVPKEKILMDYTEEEIEQAEQAILTKV